MGSANARAAAGAAQVDVLLAGLATADAEPSSGLDAVAIPSPAHRELLTDSVVLVSGALNPRRYRGLTPRSSMI